MGKRLKERVREIDSRPERVERKVKQLDCPHTHTDFEMSPTFGDYTVGIQRFSFSGMETCNECGKIVREFYSEKEYLQALRDHTKKECEEKVGGLDNQIEGLEEE